MKTIQPISTRISRRNQKFYRQANAKRIHHHKTSSTTNGKGTSLTGKHKRRKGPAKTNQKKLRKW